MKSEYDNLQQMMEMLEENLNSQKWYPTSALKKMHAMNTCNEFCVCLCPEIEDASNANHEKLPFQSFSFTRTS